MKRRIVYIERPNYRSLERKEQKGAQLEPLPVLKLGYRPRLDPLLSSYQLEGVSAIPRYRRIEVTCEQAENIVKFLNTADFKALDKVPGIGKRLATRILERRNALHPKPEFISVGQLDKILAFGEYKFRLLSAYVNRTRVFPKDKVNLEAPNKANITKVNMPKSSLIVP